MSMENALHNFQRPQFRSAATTFTARGNVLSRPVDCYSALRSNETSAHGFVQTLCVSNPSSIFHRTSSVILFGELTSPEPGKCILRHFHHESFESPAHNGGISFVHHPNCVVENVSKMKHRGFARLRHIMQSEH